MQRPMPPFPRSGPSRRPRTAASEPDRSLNRALNSASNDDISDTERMRGRMWEMRTTVTLDDELVAKAQFYTGIREKSALIREALKTLVEREAARRLARSEERRVGKSVDVGGSRMS